MPNWRTIWNFSHQKTGNIFGTLRLWGLPAILRQESAVQEKRTTFRKRVLKNAQIVLSDKAPKLDCAVGNISDAGACLQVSTTYGIPPGFGVIIEGDIGFVGRSGEPTQK
jgi:hypothetical protein